MDAFAGDLERALASGELAATKGIGRATLEVVREYAASGRSTLLEALRREVPDGLVEMLRISGLGVTKIRILHEQLRISTLAELELAARNGRLAALPKFGAKTAEKILRGIEFVRRTSAFRLSHRALRAAEQLREAVAAMPGVERVEIAGSVRRRTEVVRDVDLVVSVRGTAGAIETGLSALPSVREVRAAGEAGFTLGLDDETTADVYCAPPERFGHCLAWATGSAAHLDALAAHARARDAPRRGGAVARRRGRSLPGRSGALRGARPGVDSAGAARGRGGDRPRGGRDAAAPGRARGPGGPRALPQRVQRRHRTRSPSWPTRAAPPGTAISASPTTRWPPRTRAGSARRRSRGSTRRSTR